MSKYVNKVLRAGASYRLARMRKVFHTAKAKAARVQAYAGRKYRK